MALEPRARAPREAMEDEGEEVRGSGAGDGVDNRREVRERLARPRGSPHERVPPRAQGGHGRGLDWGGAGEAEGAEVGGGRGGEAGGLERGGRGRGPRRRVFRPFRRRRRRPLLLLLLRLRRRRRLLLRSPLLLPPPGVDQLPALGLLRRRHFRRARLLLPLLLGPPLLPRVGVGRRARRVSHLPRLVDKGQEAAAAADVRVPGAAVALVLVGRGLAVASRGALAKAVLATVVVVVRGGAAPPLPRSLVWEQDGVAAGRGGRGSGDVELLVLQGRGRRDAVGVEGKLFFVARLSCSWKKKRGATAGAVSAASAGSRRQSWPSLPKQRRQRRLRQQHRCCRRRWHAARRRSPWLPPRRALGPLRLPLMASSRPSGPVRVILTNRDWKRGQKGVKVSAEDGGQRRELAIGEKKGGGDGGCNVFFLPLSYLQQSEPLLPRRRCLLLSLCPCLFLRPRSRQGRVVVEAADIELHSRRPSRAKMKYFRQSSFVF